MPTPAGGPATTADELATIADLEAMLQMNPGDLNPATASLLLQMATAVVQEAAGGQRILQVVNDVLPVMGTTDSWLDLPQIPVTAAAVTLDDNTTVTLGTGLDADYKLVGNRVWSRYGWQGGICWYNQNIPTWDGRVYRTWSSGPAPTVCLFTTTHGYPPGSQGLQLARSFTLALARAAYVNEKGVSSESIDDYRVSYDAASAGMSLPATAKAALRRKYGRRAGYVRTN